MEIRNSEPRKNTAASFLSIGECMVELSPSGIGSFDMSFAGDTFNTAWYVRRLLPASWQVSYLTKVGTDPVSDDMVAFIQSSNISTEYVVRQKDKTPGLYMIKLENGERSFSYWRENSAARGLANDPDHLDNAMKSAGVIYFSGITMAILPEDGRKNLISALTRARETGALIAFDPNLRPALWPDTQVMCDQISRAASVADFILPSFDDEMRYFNDANLHATAERYCALGAKLVVVKNGGGKILAIDLNKKKFAFCPEPVADLTDTTAAGDAFNAAFLTAYLSNQGISSALESGCELAQKTIKKSGALVPVT